MIVNGNELADKLLAMITRDVKEDVALFGKPPFLAVIVVGTDPGSLSYIKKKQQACARVGIGYITHYLEYKTTTEQLLDLVDQINENPQCHGLLVQLPLPSHIDRGRILQNILPAKDVDCFHPDNQGLLMQDDGITVLKPCTPAAIIYILDEMKVNLPGKNVVIVNDSVVVGRPLALLLLARRCTVTICHKETINLQKITSEADILVTAVGKRPDYYITKADIKEGAIVFDIGINRQKNKKIQGDTEPDVAEKASLFIPALNGCGPLTVAFLMANTEILAFNQLRR